MRRIDSPARIWGHYASLIILAVICLTPIWVMISTSFKNEVLIFDAKPVWFFFFPTMENYDYILTRGKFDRYFVNSVIVATISTFLTLFLGGLCAYALARLEFRGRRFVANSTLLVRMVPPAVLAVPRLCDGGDAQPERGSGRPDFFLHRTQSALRDLAAVRFL